MDACAALLLVTWATLAIVSDKAALSNAHVDLPGVRDTVNIDHIKKG